MDNKCNIELINEEEYNKIAWKYYMPIWSAIIGIIGAYCIYFLILHCNRRQAEVTADVDEHQLKEKNEKVEVKEEKKKKLRLISLDTFRGFSITFMIFANYGGADYWFFEHVPWDGLTFADLLMPWFLFMGKISEFFIKTTSRYCTTRLS